MEKISRHSATWIATAFGLLTCVPLVSYAHESWPRFRGPNGSGIYRTHEFPVVFSANSFLWTAELAGIGHSSPVIANGRVFTASANQQTGEQILEAWDLLSGTKLWSRPLPGHVFPKHEFNSFASSTPALDGARLYYAWAVPESLHVVALSQSDGTVVWEVDLGPFVSQHGFGASPIVYKDLVILPDEQDQESSVVALDAATGKIRWKTPRRTQKTAYSTPCLMETDGASPQLILTSWAHGIASLDPESGQPLWELNLFHNRTVGSPVVVGDVIAASSGEGGIGREMFVVRSPSSSTERPEVLYEVKSNIPYVPTPVAYEGKLHLLYDKGVMSCLELSTGALLWRNRLPGEYFSSPVILGGKIYCISRTGTVVVLATGEQFRLLGTSELGEGTHSTPAVADGILVIRTFRKLFAVKAIGHLHAGL